MTCGALSPFVAAATSGIAANTSFGSPGVVASLRLSIRLRHWKSGSRTGQPVLIVAPAAPGSFC